MADDYPDLILTPINIGTPVAGNIEIDIDIDIFVIQLVNGRTYQFDLEGRDTSRGTLDDPYLVLADANFSGLTITQGQLDNPIIIALSDDEGVGLNSSIRYTATRNGRYALAVTTAAENDIGSYLLNTRDVTVTSTPSNPIDDYAGSTATIGTLGVGGSIAGNIETSNDRDWFRISLLSGKTYQFDLQGSATSQGTLGDPYLSLLASSGTTTIASDDDSGSGLNSSLRYTASSGGDYYLSASSFGSGTGTYRLSASDVILPTAPRGTAGNDFITLESAISTALIESGGGNDLVIGNINSNLIDSGPGNDTIRGEGGNDTINGGTGNDTTQFTGTRSNYVIANSAGGRLVADSISGRDGTDTLNGVERLNFSDGTLAFDNSRTDNAGRGYLIYRAAFDRAPDAQGLGYWIRELDNGRDFGSVVAASFITSSEFVARYGANTSNAAFLNLVYQNVLDRTPDSQGSNYWLGQLNSGYGRSNLLASFAISDENYSAISPLITDGIWFV